MSNATNEAHTRQMRVRVVEAASDGGSGLTVTLEAALVEVQGDASLAIPGAQMVVKVGAERREGTAGPNGVVAFEPVELSLAAARQARWIGAAGHGDTPDVVAQGDLDLSATVQEVVARQEQDGRAIYEAMRAIERGHDLPAHAATFSRYAGHPLAEPAVRSLAKRHPAGFLAAVEHWLEADWTVPILLELAGRHGAAVLEAAERFAFKHWAEEVLLAAVADAGLDTSRRLEAAGLEMFPWYQRVAIAARMRHVKPGGFRMGTPVYEERSSDEEQHWVELTRAFAIGITPVTQAEYLALMGNNPSKHEGLDRPVESVSWFDALRFCNALSRAADVEEAYLFEGQYVRWKAPDCPGFRLPTEAEWEYACRAGTTGARYGDLEAIAWHVGNSGRETKPVGQKQPNAWGLHDMLGNVWEWCWDKWSASRAQTDPAGRPTGDQRVLRGGCYESTGMVCRSACRVSSFLPPGCRFTNAGFRVVRSAP